MLKRRKDLDDDAAYDEIPVSGSDARRLEAEPSTDSDPHARTRKTLALTAGPVLIAGGVFVALPVIGDAGASISYLNSARQSQSAKLDAMKDDDPGFVAFRADPVWSSPEWAAITRAQMVEDEVVADPYLARLESSPLTSWAAGYARSNHVIPMDTEPVFSWRTVRAPMTDAFAAGTGICASDDPAAALAAWAPESTEYLTGFAEIFKANAPVIVTAAARSICPSDLK